jgi:hypothetical protein
MHTRQGRQDGSSLSLEAFSSDTSATSSSSSSDSSLKTHISDVEIGVFSVAIIGSSNLDFNSC